MGGKKKSWGAAVDTLVHSAAGGGGGGSTSKGDAPAHPPPSFAATGWGKAGAPPLTEAEFAALGVLYPKRFNARLQGNVSEMCGDCPPPRERVSQLSRLSARRSPSALTVDQESCDVECRRASFASGHATERRFSQAHF